jgi:hypothetical protein
LPLAVIKPSIAEAFGAADEVGVEDRVKAKRNRVDNSLIEFIFFIS